MINLKNLGGNHAAKPSEIEVAIPHIGSGLFGDNDGKAEIDDCMQKMFVGMIDQQEPLPQAETPFLVAAKKMSIEQREPQVDAGRVYD